MTKYLETAKIKKHSETIGLHPYLGNRSINMITRGQLRPRGSQSSRPRGSRPQPKQRVLQYIEVNDTHIVKEPSKRSMTRMTTDYHIECNTLPKRQRL
eukprot:4357059-Amphidinium_carterae.2